MNGKVESKSKAGTGLKIGGVWYNADKKSGVSFDGLNWKDEVEFETNAGTTFITKITKTDSAPVSQPAATTLSSHSNPKVREEMARSVAVKSVFESPTLAAQLQNGDLSNAVSELKSLTKLVTSFILTGEFKEAENNQ